MFEVHKKVSELYANITITIYIYISHFISVQFWTVHAVLYQNFYIFYSIKN
jgi:hypothetical protein